MAKTRKKNDCDAIISEILPRVDKLKEKAQEVKQFKSENLWIIKHQNFKPRYRLNQRKFHPNRKGTNMIEANFKSFLMFDFKYKQFF